MSDSTRRPDQFTAVIQPDRIPHVPLNLGDGDGFLTTLEDREGRFVVGTSPLWDTAILAWLVVGITAYVAPAVLTVIDYATADHGGHGPPLIFRLVGGGSCFLIALVLGACGFWYARHFRNRYVFDGGHGEVVATTWFGLKKNRIPLEKIADISVGEMKLVDLDDGRTAKGAEAIVAVALHATKGRRLLEIRGPSADRREAAFYLLVAARAAAATQTPLRLIAQPSNAGKSFSRLWAGLADSDQGALDAWREKYDPNPKSTGMIRAEYLLVLLILIVLAAGIGLLLTVSVLKAVLGLQMMVVASLLFMTGAYMYSTRDKAWVKPNPALPLHYLIFRNDPQAYQVVMGTACMAVGCLALFGSFFGAFVAVAKEGVGPGPAGGVPKGDGPAIEYKVVVRQNGKREVEVRERLLTDHVENVIEMLGKPEPEARLWGLREISRESNRKHHRRDEVLQLVTPYLGDEDPKVRRLAVAALGNWGRPETVAVLEPFLQDPDPDVRRETKAKMEDIRRRQRSGEI